MQHAVHKSFRIPDLFARLIDWIRHDWDYEGTGIDLWSHAWSKVEGTLGGDLDPNLLSGQNEGYAPDLHYERGLFESVPFIWEGGDYLHYAWLVHAPELNRSDHPCISSAPVDEVGAWWLGDSTRD